jgi:PPOX class probable F420-dependent enzyme
MFDAWSRDSEGLLDRPAPAVLMTYRKDGTASVSPVWFRFHEHALEVVIAEGDPKLRYLERVPECSLMVFETEPPFRGVTVEGSPLLEPDEGDRVRVAIASRYLGKEKARRFVEQRQNSGLVLRVIATRVKEWDLSAILPQE